MDPFAIESLESLKVSRGRVPAAVREVWNAVDRAMDGAGPLVTWVQHGEPANNVPDGTKSHLVIALTMEGDGEARGAVEVTHGTPHRAYVVTALEINGLEGEVLEKGNSRPNGADLYPVRPRAKPTTPENHPNYGAAVVPTIRHDAPRMAEDQWKRVSYDAQKLTMGYLKK